MKNILIPPGRGIFFISKFPRVSVHIAPWQKKIILFDFGIDLKDFCPKGTPQAAEKNILFDLNRFERFLAR